MRIALGLEYDGGDYCGWQRQANEPAVQTVQQCVERALSAVADHPLTVQCAGRTDSGVHALGQVVHFDTDVIRSMRSWVFGANSNLPRDITVNWAQEVAQDFHARFSAQRRCYRYVVFNRPLRPALSGRHMTWEYRPLELEPMRMAAAYLLGEHDFSSFRAYACQARSPLRTIYRLDISQSGRCFTMDIEANAFLHHMVRNIAGVLLTIGAGEREPAWMKEVLEFRDRQLGGVMAPANGLYLYNVSYPEKYAIPQTATTVLFGS